MNSQYNYKEIKIQWLLLGEFAAWVGASFIWPLTSVYLNKQLHISLSVIGIVLLFNNIANIIGSTLAGRLYDRMNPYPLIITGAIADAIILFLMAAFHGWPIYWVWLILTGFFGGWNSALINSIATSLKKYPARKVFTILYFGQNLGIVTGTLIVGYLYSYSITLLFVIAGLLFIVVAINAIINYHPIIAYHKLRVVKEKEKVTYTKMPKANLWVTYSFFCALVVIWLMYMNWESNLPVYMVSLGISFHLYSLLWTLNASIIVVVQMLLAKYPHIFKKILYQIVFGVVMLGISFLTLIFAKSYATFVISMVILTLGEATAVPAIPAYVNDLSPLNSKGKYQGYTLVASSIGRALGPLFGGIIIDAMGYIQLFVIASIIIFGNLLIIIPIHHKVKKKLVIFK